MTAVRAVTARLRPLASVLMLPGAMTFFGDPITNFEDLRLLVCTFYFLVFEVLRPSVLFYRPTWRVLWRSCITASLKRTILFRIL